MLLSTELILTWHINKWFFLETKQLGYLKQASCYPWTAILQTLHSQCDKWHNNYYQG